MPRRFGLLVIALGLATGLSASALGDPIGRYSRGDAGRQHGEAEPPEYHPPEDPAPIQDIVKRIASALEAANEQQESAADAERAKRDLDAQEDMAKWAMWMAIISIGGLFITAAGVFLVWRTLVATREAAHYAKEAAEATKQAVVEAKRATKAAEDAVAETRRIGEAQTRAYLSAKGAEISTDNPASICLEVVNTGQSPMRWVEIESAARAVEPGATAGEVPRVGPFNIERWSADLVEATSIECGPHTGHTTLQEIVSFGVNNQDQPRFIAFYGFLRWETMFSEIFETEFFFWSHLIRNDFKKTEDGGYQIVPRPMQHPSLNLPTYKQLKQNI